MPNSTFTYFAYGSNMLTERLRKRCTSARSIGTATALGYFLSFSKQSKDRSGKATLMQASRLGQKAHGVLFEIARRELPELDKAEGKGKGYDRDDNFPVVCDTNGCELMVTTYVGSSHACDSTLVPYDWYHALVLAGALEHRLPDSYLQELRSVPVHADPDPNRDSRREALCLLEHTGFYRLLDHSA